MRWRSAGVAARYARVSSSIEQSPKYNKDARRSDRIAPGRNLEKRPVFAVSVRQTLAGAGRGTSSEGPAASVASSVSRYASTRSRRSSTSGTVPGRTS